MNTDSKADYDLAKAEFEALKAKIKMYNQTIATLTTFVETAEAKGGVDIEATIKAAKEAYMAELEKSQRTPLHSPMSGVITDVYKLKGEGVLAGEAIVRVSGTDTTRILAYIRQPITHRPTVGDKVVVRTRTKPPTKRDSQILKIGSQIESVRATMLPSDNTALITGLPVLIQLPADLKLFPGELVDISIEYSQN